jgi:hypothetical protein
MVTRHVSEREREREGKRERERVRKRERERERESSIDRCNRKEFIAFTGTFSPEMDIYSAYF